MARDIEISVIIPFYKKIDFLRLIFQGLSRQSFRNFEVIVAEDDDARETIDFLETVKKRASFPLQHVFHKDNGFQKSKIMNKAIAVARAEFLVFLDGDCIPHRHFLKEYHKNRAGDLALFGRRVKLSEKITRKLIAENSIKKIKLLNLVLSGSDRIEDGLYLPFRSYKNAYRGICGCNWGVEKRYLMAINGHDEDYVHAGVAEDVDIEWRLIKYGLKLKKMKNKAIVYHLHHEANYTHEQELINLKLLDKKKETGEVFCKNGITKRGGLV